MFLATSYSDWCNSIVTVLPKLICNLINKVQATFDYLGWSLAGQSWKIKYPKTKGYDIAAKKRKIKTGKYTSAKSYTVQYLN